MSVAEAFAEKIASMVKMVTGLYTILLCVTLLWMYRDKILGAFVAHAIGTQILYNALLGLGSYLLAFGLSYDQKAPRLSPPAPGTSDRP